MRFLPAVSLLFAAHAAISAAVPHIPGPAGPFGIGRIGYHWIDQSRHDTFVPESHRELMVYLWYPAPHQSVARGPYLPGAPQMDAAPDAQSLMRHDFGENWPAILSGAISSHAVEGMPAVKSRRPFPVVIFSHGAGLTGFLYTCLIEDLVSRGYVVASIEHTYAAKAVWFPDGRVVPTRDVNPPPNLGPDEKAKWIGSRISEGINEGAADVRFVLDRLTALNRERSFPLAGRLDASRSAAMGHSAGAEFAARACQLDARIRACVDLDGGMFPVAALPESSDGAVIRQPLLLLEAYHSQPELRGPRNQFDAYFRKREEQLERCPRGTYAVVIRSPGIAHPSFSDIPLLFAGQTFASQEFPERAVVLHNMDLIERIVREFLGKTLGGEKAPLLEGSSAAVSDATVQPYGR
jgi:hypothetical protein